MGDGDVIVTGDEGQDGEGMEAVAEIAAMEAAVDTAAQNKTDSAKNVTGAGSGGAATDAGEAKNTVRDRNAANTKSGSGNQHNRARLGNDTGNENAGDNLIPGRRGDDDMTSSGRMSDLGSEEERRGKEGTAYTFSRRETSLKNQESFQALDSVEGRVKEMALTQETETKSKGKVFAGTITGLTTAAWGYGTWVVRGASVLASFLSALPAWTSFDPLPILDAAEMDQDDLFYEEPEGEDAEKEQEQDENVQSLFDYAENQRITEGEKRP